MIDKLKGRLVGAKDYLSKPFTTQDIVAVTESYLGVQ
jgi:twitching motility two-component system response regulator PilG